MHGTFRGSVAGGAGTTVHFGASVSHTTPLALHASKPRRKAAALLAGCCLTLLPNAAPSSHAPNAARPPVGHKRPAHPAFELAVARPLVPVTEHRRPVSSRAQASRAIAPPADRTGIEAPPVADSKPSDSREDMASLADPAMLTEVPRFSILPLPAPAIQVELPAPSPPRLAAAEPSTAPAAIENEAPRAVDIAQVSDSEVRSLRVPQLHEPGLVAAGEPTLTERIAAMQVTPLPPSRLRDSDRAALLAEAPTRMNVRMANAALGKVDFRVTDMRTIDVKLSGLLDLLAGHYDAAEFARLRQSAAADAYVSFDQLRAMGLNLRYDPVYDELRISS